MVAFGVSSVEVDATKLEEMVEAYSDTVLQRACLYLGDRTAAEDIVQAVFLSALQHELSIRNPKVWLAEATRNACMSHLRERSRHQTSELPEDFPDGQADPQLQFEQADIVRAIFSLPDELRAVIVLNYFEGYRRREIAKLLAIPEGTVASRLTRARSGLRHLLERGMER